MKIASWLDRPVHSCEPGTDCAAAACRMFEQDCGMLPVVDESGRPVGVVTDRDLTIAAATRGLRLTDLAVREVMQAPVVSCSMDALPTQALALLRRHRVRRLPVVDGEGVLRGVIGLADFLRHCRSAQPVGDMPSETQVLDALRDLTSSGEPTTAGGRVTGTAHGGNNRSKSATVAGGRAARTGKRRK